MYSIVNIESLLNNLFVMEVKAPRVAKSAKPGQFVMLRIDEKGERLPFSICGIDRTNGTITIVFKQVGESTKQLASLKVGSELLDFAGPYGHPSRVVSEDREKLNDKRILFVAEDSAAARIYPEAKYLSDLGIGFNVALSFKNRDSLIYIEKLEEVTKNITISTTDESEDPNKTTVEMLEGILLEEKFDLVIVMGSIGMMEAVCNLTKANGIETIVSLTTLMLDGTGMCGACRITVGGKVMFACQDGPEFDGHKIDFEEVRRRQNLFSSFEAKAEFRELYGKEHKIQEETAIEVSDND